LCGGACRDVCLGNRLLVAIPAIARPALDLISERDGFTFEQQFPVPISAAPEMLSMIPESNSTTQLEHAEVCHRGLVREENQDAMSVADAPSGQLFVVSDGVGGYAGGAEASRIVTEEAATHAHLLPLTGDAMSALGELAQTVNGKVYAQAQSGAPQLSRMSATVVMALVRTAGPAEAYVLNVGDSRAYLSRAGRLQQLSTDHTAAQVLVDAGTISMEESRTHAQASVLTASMGQRPEISPSITRVLLEPGDLLLLCSDGLHGYVEDEPIEQVLADDSLTVQGKKDALLQLALDAGGGDNIAIQLVSILSVAQPGTEVTATAGASGRTQDGIASPRPSGLRGFAVAVATAGVIAAASVAGYHWWQFHSTTHTTLPGIVPASVPSRPLSIPAAPPGPSRGVETRQKSTEPSRESAPPMRDTERPATEPTPSGPAAHLPSLPPNLPAAVHGKLDRIITKAQRAGDKVRERLPDRMAPRPDDTSPQP
jgi:serine/threonine protein phosphatase PrpC